MTDLTIISREEARLGDADFKAVVEGQQLAVPAVLHATLAELGVRSALGLVSHALSFPTGLAGALGWSPEDVMKAGQALAEQLEVSTAMPVDVPPISGVDVGDLRDKTAKDIVLGRDSKD